MTYQVLARKWRPRSFEEMVGQPHVLRALVNALEAGRLHHAYLFTGTRGIGKTTIARIFAKCLNCETGVTSKPCGTCSACREIDEGRFVDLIEVDAASRTKVEDTRELLDNVQYAPTRGRYKVYLIDEVHMLSGHSFNALLKTLEEPPPHVQFLLATTDPQKLPVTVLSRCLQFNLKAMPPDMIAGHLAHVLQGEGIACDRSALDLIAVAARGSMRDALSLLDQAIAFGGGRVGDAETREMLGVISRDHVFRLIEALAGKDGVALMAIAEELAEGAADFPGVLVEMLSLLQRIAIVQVVPEALRDEVDRARIDALAARLAPEDVQLFYQIALMGRRDLDFTPAPRGGFEMLLLRMLAFRPAEAETIRPTSRGAAPGQPRPMQDAQEVRPAGTRIPAGGDAGAVASPGDGGEWEGIVQALGLTGAAAQLARHCSLKSRSEGAVVLLLSAQHAGLKTANAVKKLTAALENRFGSPLRVTIETGQPDVETPAQVAARRAAERQRAAEAAIASDPLVNEICETFGGQIVPGSVRPVGGE